MSHRTDGENSECQFIDSHAHLSSTDVLPSIDEMLERAKGARISHILNICTDQKTLCEGMLLSAKHSLIRNAGSTPPHDVATRGEEDFFAFEQAARKLQLCAIGETGLDYHYEHSPKEIQKRFLKRYLHLATSVRLPVIFHCRKAFDDLFAIVDAEYKGPALLHCFTGTIEEAEEVLKRGWFLSLSGIVTFKKSAALREVAKIVPLSQLLIETDTPYLAPQSHRGKRNEPSFLPEIAQHIAEVKGIALSDIARATSENARELFGFCANPEGL